MFRYTDPVTIAGFTASGYVVLAVWGFLVLAFLALLRQYMLPKPIPGIPYNPAAAKRIFGDVPDILRAPNRRDWFAAQGRKHNVPVFQFFTSPFRGPMVFVFDHHEAQNLSMRRLKEFDRSRLTRDVFSIVVPNQMLCLASHDAQYKKNMSLVRELMTPTFLRQVSAPHIHEKVLWLLELWGEKAVLAGGRPFNSSADVHHAALDMIMGASFGFEREQSMLQAKLRTLEQTKGSLLKATAENRDDVVEFEDPALIGELAACKVIADSIGIQMRSVFPLLNAWFYRNVVPSMRNAMSVYKNMARREIGKSVERLHAGRPDRCAMDQLLAREDILAKKEGRKPDYYSETIKDELLGYLIGGHETTSSVLQWGLKYLTADQPVQTKLRKTFYQQFPEAKAQGRLPTLEEIAHPKVHMPYLEAYMQETVRHAKPLSLLMRQAQFDTTIFGIPIPKGTNISYTTHGPGYFSAPVPIDEEKRHESGRAAKGKTGDYDLKTIADFVPERWIKTTSSIVDGQEIQEEAFDPHAAPFLGFGDGPRMCFGKKLALLEMRLFLILTLWRFELEPVPEACALNEEATYLTRIPKYAFLRLKEIDYEKS
ncbi:hypothetical protein ACHAQA_006140 [Verticillium albo-atrum]